MDLVAQSSDTKRAQLFEVAGARHEPRMDAAVIEKDFWVCWTLRRLFEVIRFRPHLIFKGGTSLSKVYNAIERFSEDVDLSISRRDLGFADDHDPEKGGISRREAKRRLDELVDGCRQVIRDRLLPEMRADFASVLGDTGWRLDLDPKDPQTVTFAYPKSSMEYGLGAYINPAVRLEMGARSDDWPAEDFEIRPYAAEVFPAVFTTAASCRVHVLDAKRTFWEKATILHAEYHRPADKTDKGRLSRHYYDLYRLSKQKIGQEALARLELLDRVVKHKSFFFACSWAHYETASPGSFRLVPPEPRAEELRKDYQQMQAMIFGQAPEWDEIITGLTELEGRINGA
jgi:hypothetical protein